MCVSSKSFNFRAQIQLIQMTYSRSRGHPQQIVVKNHRAIIQLTKSKIQKILTQNSKTKSIKSCHFREHPENTDNDPVKPSNQIVVHWRYIPVHPDSHAVNPVIIMRDCR